MDYIWAFAMGCIQCKRKRKQKKAAAEGSTAEDVATAAEESQTNLAGASDFTSDMTVDFKATGRPPKSVCEYLKDDEKFKARDVVGEADRNNRKQLAKQASMEENSVVPLEAEEYLSEDETSEITNHRRVKESADDETEEENKNCVGKSTQDTANEMTKYVVKSNEEMASSFINSTCLVLPKSFSIASDYMHDLAMTSNPSTNQYAIVCGSAAEFYIRPLNTCVADMDFLFCDADWLGFSGDLPVLPSDLSGLSDTILCIQIDSYHEFPGFVRLRRLGEMRYNWKHKEYRFNQCINPHIYASLTGPEDYNHEQFYRALKIEALPYVDCGPALKSPVGESTNGFESDSVRSVFCPQWPHEAKNWPIRPRKYEWPTIDTISDVVQNGCHVVHVQHRSCRDDKLQWRLSFSVAEVILLQSWTQTQQIVYHLLRFFAKRELIQKNCPKEDEVLCTYHLKTLMLWTCEEMPPEWWNSSSVIAICCELLKKLSVWIRRRHYPNYFIPEANLFYEPSRFTVLQKTERRLNDFRNSGILCNWFIENYIQPTIQHTFKSLKSNTRIVVMYFMDYLLPLLEYRKAGEIAYLDLVLSFLYVDSVAICHTAIKYRLISGLREHLKVAQYSSLNARVFNTVNYLPRTEKVLCLKYYAALLYILQFTYGLRYGEISWDSSLFVEITSAILTQPISIRCRYHNFPKMYTEQSSRFQFLRALELMHNLTGSNSRPEFQLLSLMSKEFLAKAFEYDDSENRGITPAASAYLAALHFATSEHQQAIHYCLSVLVNHTSAKDKETLNAGCLLFIDDVARIVGLCVLHKKITDNNLHYIGKRIYLDLRLSPEVFAHYLIILSAERISTHLDFYHDLPDPSFPIDKNLMAIIKQKCITPIKSVTQFNSAKQIVYRRTDCLIETQATAANPSIVKEAVVDVMMKIALENMTSFYNVIHKDFGIKCNTIDALMEHALENATLFFSVIRKDFNIQCNTADCYRALNLYKCHQYDEVLHLCERILHEPELNNDLKEFAFANVLLLPPLDSFFDQDVQSLLGFRTLFYYLSALNDDLRECKDSSFERIFAISVYSNGYELTTFLLLDYSIKCHYFFGRHFLARYLKVRRCIDCNLPYTEAMAEFAGEKTNFPFEHTIRRFLLQKLRISKND